MFDFQGAWRGPGIDALRSNVEAQVWWGRFEWQKIIPVMLLGSSLDAGNSPTDILRPGLLLGRITSTKKWTQWSPTAVDGSEHIAGVMLYDQKMTNNSTATDRWFGFAAIGGTLKAASLIVPGNASAGISGDNYEYLVRAYLTQNGKFQLDDVYHGNSFGGFQRVVNRTTDLTVTGAMANTLFTNLGATAAVNFTLPAPLPGLRYVFQAAADYAITVTAAAVGQLIVFNDAAANSVALATAGDILGGGFEVVGLSTSKWLVTPRVWGDGVMVQTITIVS